jgi:hypothetical protein
MSRYWIFSAFLVVAVGVTGYARATVVTSDSLGISGPTTLLLLGIGLVVLAVLGIAWKRLR